MGKRQGWSVTACVFLFLSLASQIHRTTSQNHRVSEPSLRTRTIGVSQQNIKEKDLIKNLPGQPPVNFRQYGGYVAVNEKADRFLYYYFVEAINANDSTPLVIWFNGGPGCSSLQGALKSHGPFRIQSDGKTLFRNPYSWNNEANVLFLEGPIGVGFSYANTPIDVIKEGADGADKRTAEENYMFLVNWLERFPEYKKRELYITGQSYAGHYAPQLAKIILQRNNQTFINLRGVMIGNPALDPMKYKEIGAYEFMANHALISQELFDDYMKFCNGNSTEKCMDVMIVINTYTGLFDEYNIYAPRCKNSTLSSKPKESTTVMEYDPCIMNYLTAYLNRKEVQEAMHANTTKIPYPWDYCNAALGQSWSNKDRYASQLPILHELMGEGIRLWVYSGDMDLVIPVTSTMAALKRMNLTVENKWYPWLSGGEMGGFSESYKGNLKFVTVRGAGHAVPTDQPLRALTLFTSFLHNTPLPNK